MGERCRVPFPGGLFLQLAHQEAALHLANPPATCGGSPPFSLLFLPVLALAAWKTGWFPTDQVGAWAMFIGIFFLIFLVMTVGFEIYFRITGRKYDGLIGQYRKQKEKEGE